MIKNVDMKLFRKRFEKLDVLSRPFYLKYNMAKQLYALAERMNENKNLEILEKSTPRCVEYEDDFFRIRREIKENEYQYQMGLEILEDLNNTYIVTK